MPHFAAHVQWRPEPAALLRVYAPGKSFAAHDPYDWLCTLFELRPGVVEMAGVLKAPTPDQMYAALLAMHADNQVTAEQHRFRNGALDVNPIRISRAIEYAERLIDRRRDCH